MAERNGGAAPEKRIEFRIGINLGDVIAEEDDIFGDGVNIAARLEALAEPGGICVSRVVRDQVRDKLDYDFQDMGEQQVKNLTRPVRVYACRPGALADPPAARVPPATSISQPIAPRLSIVVLPFANLGSDPEQQYFTNGITEDLTTDLSRIAGIMVISRNTAFTYRDRAIVTSQIGRELSVRYVLEGSVGGLATWHASIRSSSTRKPTLICGPSVSPATRATCSPCKTRSPAASPSRSPRTLESGGRRANPTPRRDGLCVSWTRCTFWGAAIARKMGADDRTLRARAGARSAIRPVSRLCGERARQLRTR